MDRQSVEIRVRFEKEIIPSKSRRKEKKDATNTCVPLLWLEKEKMRKTQRKKKRRKKEKRKN